MRGSITRKRNRYWIVVDLDRDPGTGKRRQKWQGSWATKKEAENALPEILSALHRGTYVEPSQITLEDYLTEQWLPGIGRKRRAGTVNVYGHIVRGHILPHLGKAKLQSLSPREINSMYEMLLASGGKGRKPLAPKTVLNAHMVLRRALEDAVRIGLLTRNPASLAEPPRRAGKDMRTWNAEKLRAFLGYARDDRLYAAWLLAATTGMRRGELLGVRWRDIDFENARLSIIRTLVMVGTRPAFSEPKTAKGRRSVPLPPETVAALRGHRRSQLENERLPLGEAYEDGDLVFARENGSPLSPTWFSVAFERHVAAAGLPLIRLHDVRHTFATLALKAGVHAKVVSEILGHASIGITLDTYSHAVPSMQEEAAAKVASLIFST